MSFYVGQRPKVTKFYEKELDIERVDLCQEGGTLISENGKVFGTRVEVSLYGKRVPIKSLSEFGKLADLEPFSHLDLCSVDEGVVGKIVDRRTRHQVWAYQRRVQMVGAHQARKEFSQGRNFQRTVGRFLKRLPGFDLQTAYQNRLTRFFAAHSAAEAKLQPEHLYVSALAGELEEGI